jgi:hypothetical protein
MLTSNYGISLNQMVENGETTETKGNRNCETYSSEKDISENKGLWYTTVCRLRYYLFQINRT